MCMFITTNTRFWKISSMFSYTFALSYDTNQLEVSDYKAFFVAVLTLQSKTYDFFMNTS